LRIYSLARVPYAPARGPTEGGCGLLRVARLNLVPFRGLPEAEVRKVLEAAREGYDQEGHGWLGGRDVTAAECGLTAVRHASPHALTCTEVEHVPT
jgi:hypothetical protein